MPHFLLACLLACCLPLALAAGSSPRDLGVVPVPSTNTRAELPLVVFMTGDGGWAALDKGVSTRLAAAGWPVIGWSTLTYFWHKKTPEQVTADLLDLLDHYRQRWPNRTWVLIGFSFGAEIVPFIINRLPAAERARLLAGVMLSPSTESDFEIHVSDWVSSNKYQGYATQPETERISDIPLFCFYGQEDDDPDVLCPLLTQRNVTNIALPGGQHFEDDYPWTVTLLHRHIPLSR